ncbi:Rap1a/Tai family immunity protein [Magnetospirillum gryphiswaldense]|uniref:Rap1a/Tai family immunity protein n=1 Tax=Magnetospirillum gryphiswaldense TaxID=55518 RepID=UPI001319EA44|nr:Rap1a/Tai family immunity protein [Magnetospirillum gryphiswaldense]
MRIIRHCSMALLLILSGISKSHSNEVDGNFIMNACNNNSSSFADKVAADAFCTGFVFGLRGAFDMSLDFYKIPVNNRFYCAPNDVTLQQTIDVFVKYLKENPSARNNTGRALFAKSMNEAFPCK